MKIKIALENNMEGRSMVWALEHPGCFAYGSDGKSALEASPDALQAYANWVARHNQGKTWLEAADLEIELVESWDVYSIDEKFDRVSEGGDYEVNAWFQHDWKPLEEQEAQRARMLLNWSREDLLRTIADLSPEALESDRPGQRWNIAGILNHVSGAEWWYLDRLGLAFPRQEVPDDPIERLGAVRERLLEVLPTLIGSNQVVGKSGEFWSPRKLVRRAVWHERDHTFHIQGLMKT